MGLGGGGPVTPSVTLHGQASSASLLPAWDSKPQVPCLVSLTPSGWHNCLLPPSGGLLLRTAFRITRELLSSLFCTLIPTLPPDGALPAPSWQGLAHGFSHPMAGRHSESNRPARGTVY